MPIFVVRIAFVSALDHAAHSGTGGACRVAKKTAKVPEADINLLAIQVRTPVISTRPTPGKAKDVETSLPNLESKII